MAKSEGNGSNEQITREMGRGYSHMTDDEIAADLQRRFKIGNGKAEKTEDKR